MCNRFTEVLHDYKLAGPDCEGNEPQLRPQFLQKRNFYFDGMLEAMSCGVFRNRWKSIYELRREFLVN